MPDRYYAIEETATLVNDITFQVIHTLLKDLGVSSVFTEDTISITADDLRDSNVSDGGHIRTSGDRCHVILSPVLDPRAARWDVNSFDTIRSHGVPDQAFEHQDPLFHDKGSGVRLWEYGQPANLKMEISLRFKDKNKALTAMSALTTRYYASGRLNTHDILFTYPLDLQILRDMWWLYGMTGTETGLFTWLQNGLKKEVAVEGNDADSKRVVLKTVQMNATGQLEHDQERPEAQTVDNVTDRWTLNFQYTIQFHRPHLLRIWYPCVIGNAFLPKSLVPPKETEDHLFHKELAGTLRDSSIWKYTRGLQRHEFPVVRLPFYEDFMPVKKTPQLVHGYTPLLISCFTLEIGEDGMGRETIDLEALPGLTLDPTFQDLLQLQGNDIMKIGGLFNIVFYVDGVPYRHDQITRDGLKFSIETRHVDKRWHYVLYESRDICFLNAQHIREILARRWFFPLHLARSMDDLIRRGLIETLPSYEAIHLVREIQVAGLLDDVLDQIIDQGRTDAYIRRVAGSPYGLAEYLVTIHDHVDRHLLWHAFVAAAQDLDKETTLSIQDIPDPIYRLADSGLPVTYFGKDCRHAASLPSRILFTSLHPE